MRAALAALQAPLLCGTIFHVFALLAGGLVVAFGVSERVAGFVSIGGFWIGFVVGCSTVVGGFLEIFATDRGRSM